MIRLRSFAIPALAAATLFATAVPGSAQPTAPGAPAPDARPRVKVVRPGVPVPANAQRAVLDHARAEIERALAQIDGDPHIPAKLKAKIKAKLAKTMAKLAKGEITDLEDFGAAMEAFGEEMADFGDELEEEIKTEVERALRDQGIDIDVDLDELQLTKAQRAELRRIGRDQQVVIAPAEQKIHELSRELRKVVDEINADEGQVGRLIDQISAEEAKVRKARITAMTRTRKVLNEAQRRKLDR